jgi:hypothetical protein
MSRSAGTLTPGPSPASGRGEGRRVVYNSDTAVMLLPQLRLLLNALLPYV